MENKINIARFKEDYRTAEVKDIWQWDYGQILRIQGLNLPTAVEIHFSLDEHGGEAARRIGVTKDGVTDVPIPDSMVENESAYGDSYYFFAYVYLSDEESGNTEYKIRAKVSTRSKPEGYNSGDSTFAAILKTVNEIAEDKVDVPVPAKVGQVLAVKVTDESGKPTEFEAKDMSGGVSDEKISEAVGTYMEAHPIEETDPTVPDWAKQPEKPSYTAEEVGALPAETKIPSKTSDLQNDSGFLTEYQDLSGYALKSEVPKSASDVGADASGTAVAKVSEHNTASNAHNDIRLLVQGLTERLNALADSDDTTLDQMSEVVTYIKSNKSLIDAITTSKVNVSDIIDNLTANVSNKPLSAAQGVKLKALIDAIVVPTKLSELENDSGYAKTTDIPDKLPNPQKLTFTGSVTAEYDGSGAVTVTIPESSGGSATVVSPLKGKYASFLGDSITTYQGYIPDGYETYYTASNLASVDDTWWKKVIDATGMNLCVNESYSGTRVAVTSWLGDYAGCLPKRCMNLHTAEHIPDVIFVLMGCNDFNNEIEIGDYSSNDGLSFDDTKFSDAYAQMLYYITTKYPMAKVYCCTCPTSEKNAPTDGVEVNGNGLAFYEFNGLIRKIARMFNCDVIDLESCGITHENIAYYMVDGIQHPNAYGHSLMANKAIETIDKSNATRYANLEAVMKPSATGVSLDKTTLELEKGKTETLTATVVPSDAVIKSVKWTTSDSTKATVSNGVVTAVGEGYVTITVTTDDGGYTAQCNITVTSFSVADAQVTAITNTAGQYIDTGYVPTANTKFEMDWKLETFVAQMHVVGAKGLAVKYGNSNSTVMCNRHSNQQALTYVYDASTRSVLGLDGTTLYKDGTAVNTKSTSAVTMEQSLVLFGANGYSSAADLVTCTGTYTLYGFKIYESDELVKNFVPWVDADGKACLKEIIGGTFHYDATGGTFEYI